MSLFDRHLLREWFAMLVLVLAALCGLLVVQICYDDLRTMLEAGAHLGEVLRYLLVTLPSFFAFTFPVAILISLLLTLNRLHRANELTAMRAAGIGFGRLMAPIWICGVGACVLVWWLNTTVIPWSVEQSRAREGELQYRKQARSLSADYVGATFDVAFDEPGANRLWFFDRYSQATHHGYGVSVSELDRNRRETSQLLAAEAWRDSARGWIFREGRELRFDDTGEPTANVPFAEKIRADYQEDPQLMLLTDKRPQDLSFFELQRLMNYFAVQNQAKRVPYAIRYYSIWATTLAPLIVIGIAIPFAVTGVRVNPAVGVSKAIGLFVLYYVLAVVSSSLADHGLVAPATAAWLPDGGMAGLALWLFVQLR